MANLLNAAGDQTLGGDPGKDRSAGQILLDRQLAVRSRLREVYQRLGAVRANILTPAGASGGIAGGPAPATRTSFFDGMALLTEEFEAVAAQLETSVADLETLF